MQQKAERARPAALPTGTLAGWHQSAASDQTNTGRCAIGSIPSPLPWGEGESFAARRRTKRA